MNVRRSLRRDFLEVGNTPKPGYSGVTIPKTAYDQLVELAKQSRTTVSTLLS